MTNKVKTKTQSKYIRKGMIDQVRRMTKVHKKLKGLLSELAEVNWELLKLESEL